jgi:hypothetical protein
MLFLNLSCGNAFVILVKEESLLNTNCTNFSLIAQIYFIVYILSLFLKFCWDAFNEKFSLDKALAIENSNGKIHV